MPDKVVGKKVSVGSAVEIARFGLQPDFRASDYHRPLEVSVGVYYGGKPKGIPDTFVTVKFQPTKGDECAKDFSIIDEIVCARNLNALACRIDQLLWEMYSGIKQINFVLNLKSGMHLPSNNINALSDFLEKSTKKGHVDFDSRSLYACLIGLADRIKSRY